MRFLSRFHSKKKSSPGSVYRTQNMLLRRVFILLFHDFFFVVVRLLLMLNIIIFQISVRLYASDGKRGIHSSVEAFLRKSVSYLSFKYFMPLFLSAPKITPETTWITWTLILEFNCYFWYSFNSKIQRDKKREMNSLFCKITHILS